MEENNNFFGFVSKIGFLINNNKSQDKETKKKGEQKKYNIKISTDDEKNLENIQNQIDDEEEEEEEEEEEKKEEQKVEEDKEKEEEKNNQDESNLEKEKIKNMVLEIMNNNNEEDEKEEDNIDNENNIINTNNIENNNSHKKIVYPKIFNNSFPAINNISVDGSQSFIFDETTSCHVMLKKGNDININEYIIIPILFMEKQKNIFYKMRMINNPKYEQKKYLLFFDEHFLYFAKDEIISEEMDEETRRITKIISLFDISDFSTDNENDNFLIKFLVIKDENKEKEVKFYIEQNYFSGFIKNFNLKLSIYGIDFFSNKSSN